MKKSLEFYAWYFSTHKPDEQLYSASDLRAMSDSRPTEQDNELDLLAEWIQRQPKVDGVGVMDAIQREIELAQRTPRKAPDRKGGALESVKSALVRLADQIEQ